MGAVKCLCRVDTRFPVRPAGILKIIEMVLGVLGVALIGWGRNNFTIIAGSSPSTVEAQSLANLERVTIYEPVLNFCLATSLITWMMTILMFLLFLFCMPEISGGILLWSVTDSILDIVWVLMYSLTFVLLCVTCGFPTDHSWLYSPGLAVATVFALLLTVAYLLSLVFNITALKRKRLY